jgi:hypothetical protein
MRLDMNQRGGCVRVGQPVLTVHLHALASLIAHAEQLLPEESSHQRFW